MTILQSIEKYVALSKEEAGYFTSILETRMVKQGELIEKPGEITPYFIYVKSGCLMTYFIHPDGSDHVVQFATSSWWTSDLASFTKVTPSNYATKALADSEVHLIYKKDFDGLLERYPAFEKFFRLLFQNSLITHQNRIIQTVAHTAEERYDYFQQKYPTLEQFVPQKYIASYLGITPEFLSKIRRKKMGR
jgi:CRP-like cAMP-binding protein